jgi:hypothetical protein
MFLTVPGWPVDNTRIVRADPGRFARSAPCSQNSQTAPWSAQRTGCRILSLHDNATRARTETRRRFRPTLGDAGQATGLLPRSANEPESLVGRRIGPVDHPDSGVICGVTAMSTSPCGMSVGLSDGSPPDRSAVEFVDRVRRTVATYDPLGVGTHPERIGGLRLSVETRNRPGSRDSAAHGRAEGRIRLPPRRSIDGPHCHRTQLHDGR